LIDDIAVAGRNAARWNGRDVIAPQDLPITKGVQERMREFDKFEEADEIRATLAETLRRPPPMSPSPTRPSSCCSRSSAG
jgi:hypothetical protein